MPPLSVAFVGAESGTWSVGRLETVSGEPLASASRLEVLEGSRAAEPVSDAVWVLRGVTSNERYVNRIEHSELLSRQEPLGRARSTRAALIPITKSEAWWDLAQDERRLIFEESSHHIAIGLEYLPAVARRLHHGRDPERALGASRDAPLLHLHRLRLPPEAAASERPPRTRQGHRADRATPSARCPAPSGRAPKAAIE